MWGMMLQGAVGCKFGCGRLQAEEVVAEDVQRR